MLCWRRDVTTLIFSYIPKLGHFFFFFFGGGGGGGGVAIFFYFFSGGGFRKNEFCLRGWGMKILWIFWGSSQNLTSFSFFFYWHDRMRSLRQGVQIWNFEETKKTTKKQQQKNKKSLSAVFLTK